MRSDFSFNNFLVVGDGERKHVNTRDIVMFASKPRRGKISIQRLNCLESRYFQHPRSGRCMCSTKITGSGDVCRSLAGRGAR